MDTAMIAASAAISGSAVGAVGSVIGTWMTQRHHDRYDLLAKKIANRETLYSDFITESARLLVHAHVSNNSDPQMLVPLYALLSRIRLSSSPDVLARAEEVIRTIIITYPKPNLTPDELASRALTFEEDPLKPFSNSCRDELEGLQGRVLSTRNKSHGG
jgi:hypothetical protein